MSTYSAITLTSQVTGPTLTVGQGISAPGVLGVINAITRMPDGTIRLTVQPLEGEPVSVDVDGMAFGTVLGAE